jgi:2'-5' RNA ligase
MRLFVAAELPATVRARVRTEVTDRLRPALRDAAWVAEPALHLTLRFIGEQSPTLARRLGADLETALRGGAPVPLTLRGVGAFPNLSRPRVVWLGVHAPELTPVQARVEACCTALGLPAETRPYQPHLTLARLRPPAAGRPQPALAGAAESLSFESSLLIETVTLMQSELGPGGARHTPLTTIVLGAR